MAAWTPEPWRHGRRRTLTERGAYLDAVADPSKGKLDLVAENMRPDDAERVSVCVNACQNIANPAALPEVVAILESYDFEDCTGCGGTGYEPETDNQDCCPYCAGCGEELRSGPTAGEVRAALAALRGEG